MFLKSKWQLFIVLHKTDSNEIPWGTKNKKNKTWDLTQNTRVWKSTVIIRRIWVQDFNVNLENKRKIRTVNSLSRLELATCHSLHFKSDKFG